jgi:hypothetical protein
LPVTGSIIKEAKMFKRENGQAIVILAVALVVLLAFVALAIDAGNGYTATRQAQNAADAAALAGARQIVLECAKQGLNPGPNEAEVRSRIDQMVNANTPGAASEASSVGLQAYYVDVNGARLSQNEIGTLGALPCNCPSRGQGVEVIVHNTVPSFFAGLIGRPNLDVQATSKARYGAVNVVTSGLYPFTRRNTPLAFNQTVTLRILDNADEAPGNFGWLTWDGQNNVPALADSLTPPGNSQIYYNPGVPPSWTADFSDHVIATGKWVQGAPGNKNSSQVRSKLDWFISTQTPMIIPLYDDVSGEGSHMNYKVASFAAFLLQSYDFTGQNKSMTGTFVKWVTNGDWAQGITCTSDPGVESVKLTP